MKPRQESVLAEEDWLVWLFLRDRPAGIRFKLLPLLDAYESADRRDDDIMLIARREPTLGNICMRGEIFDWKFDVIVRLGLWRAYWAESV